MTNKVVMSEKEKKLADRIISIVFMCIGLGLFFAAYFDYYHNGLELHLAALAGAVCIFMFSFFTFRLIRSFGKLAKQ